MMNQLKRILLVEDSPRDAELTIEAFAEYNLANAITHLRDGAEVLDYLYARGVHRDRSPDAPALILLDLKMPKVGGLEVLRQIKGEASLKTIPVVVMTSSCEERDLVESYRLGVNGYVVKPVKFPEFVEAVRHLGAYWAVLNEVPRVTLPAP